MLLRAFFVAAGTVSVFFGIAGVLLPMVPATPFLLLATFFYARSSPRFLRWLVEHPWLGPYISNYRDRKPLTRGQLVSILGTLWISFAISIALVDIAAVRALLVVIPIGVTIYLLRRNRSVGKTEPPDFPPRTSSTARHDSR